MPTRESSRTELTRVHCGDCFYWDTIKLAQYPGTGTCKFNAPITNDTEDPLWPLTHKTDWCGDGVPTDSKEG